MQINNIFSIYYNLLSYIFHFYLNSLNNYIYFLSYIIFFLLEFTILNILLKLMKIFQN